MLPLNATRRLSSYVEPYEFVLLASKALLTAWLHALLSADLTAFCNFSTLRDRAFGTWYKEVDAHFFAFEEECSPVPQLVGSAYGTVLELGPATGNQIARFDKGRVRRIYGVEPMVSVHGELRKRVVESGWGERYVQIVGGVEDVEMLERAGISEGSVDCVVSIQVLCSVEDPEVMVRRLYDLLKPGGELIFWEHHESHDLLTGWVQWGWDWVWPLVIGGCRLDRRIRELLLGAGEWERVDIEGDEEAWALFPRVWGRLTKVSCGDDINEAGIAS